jgi:hypothetical protein
MGSKRWVTIPFFVLAVVTLAAQMPAPNPPQSNPGGEMPPMSMDRHGPSVPADLLTSTFAGKSAQWTPASLAALPHKTLTVFNTHAKVNQTYSGVLLADLLASLGVPQKPHGKEFLLYLVAQGADGYQVVFSVGEVTPDVHDATVMVADTLDGKSLGANGSFQLVASGETRPARWVRNLVAIRVETAQ